MAKRMVVIVVGTDEIVFRRRVRGGGKTLRFPLPPGAFGDAGAMTAAVSGKVLDKILRHANAVVLVNTGRSAVRVETVTARPVQEVLSRHFPAGDSFNTSTHVMGWHVYNGDNNQAALFMAALPTAVADNLTELCRALRIPMRRIKRIDVIENALVEYFRTARKEPVWLCLPQDGGIRVLSVSGGAPNGCWTISNAPAWRETDLQRLWAARRTEQNPETALLLTADGGLDWMNAFFTARGVAPVAQPIPEEAEYERYTH